ncbi:30S ribosomal protein S8 [Candidatus Calescamantes bacterium]|nr:30S ribosomal protein S8 [Candidatus Calescamantes bacterium]
MSVSDPIADFLNHLKTSSMVKKPFIITQHSKLKEEIAKILQREGFIEYYSIIEEGPKKKLHIHLKYGENGVPAITGVKKVSRPGAFIYVKRDEIPRVKSGYGIAIISTSKGLKTDEECRKEGIGGKVICYIW